jgi:hypothetical protein
VLKVVAPWGRADSAVVASPYTISIVRRRFGGSVARGRYGKTAVRTFRIRLQDNRVTIDNLRIP